VKKKQFSGEINERRKSVVRVEADVYWINIERRSEMMCELEARVC
jgi:hypothetical protein